MALHPRTSAARRWSGSASARPELHRPIGVGDGVCILLCLGVAVLTGAAAVARFVWVADVLSLFRTYAALVAGVVLLACLANRRTGLILLATVLLVAELALVVLPAARGDGLAHGALANGVKGRVLEVITFNCLGSNPNADAATTWMRGMHPDILVLEEIPEGWKPQLATLADVLPYRASGVEQTPSDTDVFSRLPIRAADTYRPATDKRTHVHAVLDLAGRPLQVFGIHPNTLQTAQEWSDRNDALELIAQWVAQTRRSDATLLMGDWNTPTWSPYFHSVLKIAGLQSADSVLWPPPTRVLARPFGVAVGSPIDHVAASPQVRVIGCETGPNLGSDHVPQICHVAITP